jgi:hypothetical protein
LSRGLVARRKKFDPGVAIATLQGRPGGHVKESSVSALGSDPVFPPESPGPLEGVDSGKTNHEKAQRHRHGFHVEPGVPLLDCQPVYRHAGKVEGVEQHVKLGCQKWLAVVEVDPPDPVAEMVVQGIMLAVPGAMVDAVGEDKAIESPGAPAVSR